MIDADYGRWLSLGQAHQNAGRSIDAMLCYRQALKSNRHAVIVQFHLGEVMRDVVGECVQVAARGGVSVQKDIFETVMGIAASMPNQYSSTAQDLARGKTTEIEHLNGYVVRKAAELGLSAPVNRALLVVLKGLESKAGSQ